MPEKLTYESLVQFLADTKLAVLSTVTENGLPHAASIYFVFDENNDFHFVTPEKTRKSLSIDANNEVALTITDEESNQTVQVKGRAQKDTSLNANVVTLLAEKLNKEERVVKTLPLLKFKDQKKISVTIKPYEILMRRYTNEGMDEYFIEPHKK